MTHDDMMQGYYLAREAQDMRAEEYTYGYATEEQEFYSTVEPRLTFKMWLTSLKGCEEP